MSDIQPIIIRDPEVFQNDRTVQTNRTPFELTTDSFCGSRNASGLPYQNYSGYSAKVEDISSIVNEISSRCKDPNIRTDRLFKYTEDLGGYKFFLFKSISIDNPITDKRLAEGELKILSPDGELVTTIGNHDTDGREYVDVQIFGDKILLVEYEQVWFGNSYDLEFQSRGYMSFFTSVAFEDDVVFMFDGVLGDFILYKYDGKQLIELTPDGDPLSVDISSGALYSDKNRIMFYRSDTLAVSDDSKRLQVWEFDLVTKEWNGIELPDFFPYEIIGGYSDGAKHYIFHEKITYPNQVGGICVEFSAPAAEVVDTVQPCDPTEDIYIDLNAIPEVVFTPLELNPDIIVQAFDPPPLLKADNSSARLADAIETWQNQNEDNGDVTQSTVVNQPTYIPSGVGDRFLQLSGTPDTHASVPVTIGALTEIDVRVYDIDALLGAQSQTLVSDYVNSGTEKSWVMQVNSSGQMRLTSTGDGTNIYTTISDASINPWVRGTSCRFTWEATTNLVKFYTLVNGVWEQLGTDRPVAAMGSLNDTSNDIEIGGWDFGNNDRLYGGLSRVQIFDEIDGTTPLLDADFSTADEGTNPFVCETGQTITFNNEARVIDLSSSEPYLYLPSDDNSNAIIASIGYGSGDAHSIGVKFKLASDSPDTYIFSTRDTGGGALSLYINSSNQLEIHRDTTVEWTSGDNIISNYDYEVLLSYDGVGNVDLWSNEFRLAETDPVLLTPWDSSKDFAIGGRFTTQPSATQIPHIVYHYVKIYDSHVLLDDLDSTTPVEEIIFKNATHNAENFEYKVDTLVTIKNEARIVARPLVNFDGVDDIMDLPAFDYSNGYTVNIKMDVKDWEQDCSIFSIQDVPYDLELQKNSGYEWVLSQNSVDILTVDMGTHPLLRAVIAHDPDTGKIYGNINGTTFNVDEEVDISSGGAVPAYIGARDESTLQTRGVFEELFVVGQAISTEDVETSYEYLIKDD